MPRTCICIECGHRASELYRDFQGGIIKISHCAKCLGIVDKYIEFDSVIICLDAILHKPQTYRHLLFNIDTSSTWKLVMIFLLCDTYIKWSSQKAFLGNSSSGENHLFYAAFESEIYSVFLIVYLEWMLLCGSVFLLLNLLHVCSASVPLSPNLLKPFSKASVVLIHRVLVVSSFGKLLAIPVIIWGQTFGDLYLPLTKVLTFTSNLTAIKVVYKTNQIVMFCILLLGHAGQHLAGETMMSFLYGWRWSISHQKFTSVLGQPKRIVDRLC